MFSKIPGAGSPPPVAQGESHDFRAPPKLNGKVTKSAGESRQSEAAGIAWVFVECQMPGIHALVGIK